MKRCSTLDCATDAWREWALSIMAYLPWRKVTIEMGTHPVELEELSDEHLRALFSFTLGYHIAGAYREARETVVRELAGLKGEPL